VAAGLSGPGRYRFGGVRDFILGVRYVDGEGEVVRGGGKVVKNAAGFDLPKLMVGSLGQLGALAALSFKVFPRPEAYLTLSRTWPSLDLALQALLKLCAAPVDLDALDLLPSAGGDYTLLVRLGGLAQALPRRAERLAALLDGAGQLAGADDAETWRTARELAWVPAGWTLVKVPLTPKRIPALEARLAGTGVQRRYSVGGNVGWLAAPEPSALEAALAAQGLPGLVVLGAPGRPLLGPQPGESFGRRVRSAMDPKGRFSR
jgi:glycolate oxidase FAD binding subunit